VKLSQALMKQHHVMIAAMNSQMMKVTHKHHSVLLTLKQMTTFLRNLKVSGPHSIKLEKFWKSQKRR